MATTRPFAYNTGSTITGTLQVGNLAIGVDSLDYSTNPGGVKWWNGPDEDLGYVITKPIPSGNQPNPLGVPAYVAFNRSDSLTDESFLGLVNSLSLTAHTFTNASNAKTWLNDNGYWTSWEDSGPTLLANLDASNSSSYPGTGTDWFDLTTNNNDGTLDAGSGTITYGTTNGGEFDLNAGTGTKISFSNNADLALNTSTTKTYSLWFNTDAVGFINFSRTLITKQVGNPVGDGFWMGINSNNQLVARVTSDGGSTNKSISGIGATISIGTWYMATLVVKVSSDTNTFKLYLDTTEVGSTNGGGSTINDIEDLFIGNYVAGLQNVQPYDGKIAEFRVYEGDFEPADVKSLFDSTKTRFSKL